MPSTREPAAQTFEALWERQPEPAAAAALYLRELVRRTVPNAEETFYPGWRLLLFRKPKEFCGIGAGKETCNFYLTRGAELPDPEGVMEGRGKAIRHVKVRCLEEAPLEAIRALIELGYDLSRE